MSKACDGLIEEMRADYTAVKEGKITHQVAQAMARTAGEICRAARAKTLYQIARGEKPEVPFFE